MNGLIEIGKKAIETKKKRNSAQRELGIIPEYSKNINLKEYTQKVKSLRNNAQGSLSSLVKKAIDIQEKRNASRKNFEKVSNGNTQVSNYRNVKSENNKRRTNPRPKVRVSKKNLPEKSEELENKITNYKELYLLGKEELAELRKRDELRTRMLTEDYEELSKSLERSIIERLDPYSQSNRHNESQNKLSTGITVLEGFLTRIRMMLECLTPKEMYIISREEPLINLSKTNPYSNKINYGKIKDGETLRDKTRDEYIKELSEQWDREEEQYLSSAHSVDRQVISRQTLLRSVNRAVSGIIIK